jgi:hypothetical protein
MGTFDSLAEPRNVDALFDYAATQGKPAIGVFAAARTESQLADQLLALAAGTRWRVRLVAVPIGLCTSDVFVSVAWHTSDASVWSSPMGLGPFGTMPATRRSPYTVIAAWTGGRLNPFRRKTDPFVHLLDVDVSAYGFTAETYKETRKNSEKSTRELLFDDKAENYRNVAFRLSAATASTLAALPQFEAPV